MTEALLHRRPGWRGLLQSASVFQPALIAVVRGMVDKWIDPCDGRQAVHPATAPRMTLCPDLTRSGY